MEEKTYKSALQKIEGSDCLVFEFGPDDKKWINLNSEDQSYLKDLFFKIIELTFEEKPVFILDPESEKYPAPVFIEIAKEYIKDLNEEIGKIMAEQPSFE